MRGTQVDDRRSQSRPPDARSMRRRESSNMRPNVAVELPLSPGGAREGWGEGGVDAAKIATYLVAIDADLVGAEAINYFRIFVTFKSDCFNTIALAPALPQPPEMRM
jgi:hypothetical protein